MVTQPDSAALLTASRPRWVLGGRQLSPIEPTLSLLWSITRFLEGTWGACAGSSCSGLLLRERTP